MTGRCGTCRHWAEGAQGRPGRGNCQAIGETDAWSTVDALASVTQGGSGGVWLETRAEFGCLLHEQAP